MHDNLQRCCLALYTHNCHAVVYNARQYLCLKSYILQTSEVGCFLLYENPSHNFLQSCKRS